MNSYSQSPVFADKSKKIILFIIGFFVLWLTVVGIVVFTQVIHPFTLFTYIFHQRDSSILPTTSIENPLPKITARFLSTNDLKSYISGEKPTLLCAYDSLHAKQIFQEVFSGEEYAKYAQNRYFTDEIESADWKSYPEYITATFARKVDETGEWGLLKCDYFENQNAYAVYDQPTNDQAGIFKQTPTKENLDHLVWFLMRADIVSMSGFNQGALIKSSKTEETGTDVIRTDIGIYSVSNDTQPFETRRSDVRFQYRLRKSDGVLFYTNSKTKQ